MDPQTTTIINILNDPRYTLLFLALAAWGLTWKGIALWKSARNQQKKWFIVLLILNTFGILEIVYIFYFSKKVPKVTENTLPK